MRTPTEILTDLQSAVAAVEKLQAELADSMRIKEIGIKDRAIIRACKVWNVSPRQMTNGSRHSHTVLARWFAWRLMEQEGCSDTEIGHAFNRNRTTVGVGLRRLEWLLENDREVKEKWSKL